MARSSESTSFQPGKLDRKVLLYHRVLTKNEQNENEESWPSVYAEVWGGKSDLRGQKRLLAQQFSHEQQTEWTLRYRSDVVLTDRLVDENGNTYEILDVAEVGRRAGLSCLCRAVK
jgi:SPP1 family predicted phage head-tail adaptor